MPRELFFYLWIPT